ncbi:MAG: signal peptidase I [Deltaproteobacteria bacterium]|nr:signal peptidase I [Deltaproteobacteria bacterium]
MKKSKIREYIESLLVALVIAFFLRSFVVEAFKIPSGSMIPTLLIGDHIFVNKFTYGLRIPFTKQWIKKFKTPERGEVVVFIWPVEEDKDFIKRVVGLPGDTLRIEGDALFVNGEPVNEQKVSVVSPSRQKARKLVVLGDAIASEAGLRSVPYYKGWDRFDYFVEELGEVKHLMQIDHYPNTEHREITIPPDHLFVMGDNRDNSADSREWGFVPMENVKGQAMFIWLSLDTDDKRVRWERFGKWIR